MGAERREPADPGRRLLARDLAEILWFTHRHPDVDYMAGLLLGMIREGRYDEARKSSTRVPGPYSGT